MRQSRKLCKVLRVDSGLPRLVKTGDILIEYMPGAGVYYKKGRPNKNAVGIAPGWLEEYEESFWEMVSELKPIAYEDTEYYQLAHPSVRERLGELRAEIDALEELYDLEIFEGVTK